MSAKKKKVVAEDTFGSQKLSKFFQVDPSRKRLREDDVQSVPSSKRPSPPSAATTPSPAATTPSPAATTPSPAAVTPSPEPGSPLSQEQKLQIERKKLEGESRLTAKRFGAEKIGLSWLEALRAEFKRPYMQQLIEFVKEERSNHPVYPPPDNVFSWTLSCDIKEVKVVILGQDPYHGPGQAHGMCFSVKVGVPVPPSLVNIFKELASDVENFQRPKHGYLMGWARQGVLLLNACLTVRHKLPKSHADKGWEKLTDAVVHWLNDNSSGIVFLLWGKDAQKKCSFIDSKKHCVLKSVHPSPLSAHRGFLGCKHFSQANFYLKQNGKKEINWSSLPEK